jgi:hypothetical protein
MIVGEVILHVGEPGAIPGTNRREITYVEVIAATTIPVGLAAIPNRDKFIAKILIEGPLVTPEIAGKLF